MDIPDENINVQNSTLNLSEINVKNRNSKLLEDSELFLELNKQESLQDQ